MVHEIKACYRFPISTFWRAMYLTKTKYHRLPCTMNWKRTCYVMLNIMHMYNKRLFHIMRPLWRGDVVQTAAGSESGAPSRPAPAPGRAQDEGEIRDIHR